MLILRTLFTFLVLLTVSQFCKADFVVFESDFNGAMPTKISGAGSLVGVQGYNGLGPVGNQFSGNFIHNTTASPTATTLTLTGLAVHTTVNLEFLLAVIDSWDNDDFFVRIDGNTVFSTRFQNSGNGGAQVYVPPAGVQLAYREKLGFNPGETPTDFRFLDSAYNMGLDPAFQNIPHTSSTMTVQWLPGNGVGLWTGGTDESFAIDNVRVTINAVPEPTSSVLLVLAGSLFAIRRRSNKSR